LNDDQFRTFQPSNGSKWQGFSVTGDMDGLCFLLNCGKFRTQSSVVKQSHYYFLPVLPDGLFFVRLNAGRTDSPGKSCRRSTG
ncbi:hypothetical protein ABMZ18_23135, partial [Escherichia coli]|uniref:hypothetical protein n=1 Tax=Escherichia coli TaxID=562 RepID=UPI0039BDE178